MKPHPCFEVNKELEVAARQAERRKRDAIARLVEKLGIGNRNRFGQAMRDLIAVDKRVLEEKGR
jgi:hypothetical protein